jgi:hypothetical protein
MLLVKSAVIPNVGTVSQTLRSGNGSTKLKYSAGTTKKKAPG